MGGSLFFKYPSPFNGVPAGTELLTRSAFEDGSGAAPGVGERGVENGCAAEVEVATGGPS